MNSSSFFKELDELIELKSNKLISIKKLFKNIINNNINNVEKMKSCKIDELYEVTRGKYIKKDSLLNDGFPVYSSKTMDNGILGYTDSYLFENALIWSTDGANAGKVRYIKNKFNCTNVCGVLLNNNDYCNKYMEYYLNHITKKYVSNSGIPKLMNDTMSNIKINIPNIKEQIKISNQIEEMENLINLYEREIEKLLKIKKFYLNNIF